MAKTVDARRVKERFDSEAALATKLDTLTAFIRDSANTVFFTGAGVSTSAGVSDYRGPSGTWTRRRIAELRNKTDPVCRAELTKLLAEARKEEKKAPQVVPTTDAKPTYTHMAQAQLIRANRAHHIITTNLDGLYRKSGLKQHQHFTCLHGDMYVERCTACRKEFERNYHVRRGDAHVHQHSVGTCGACGSAPPKNGKRVLPGAKDAGTIDTHINFGEELDDYDWFEAEKAAEAAELCVVMGTSMSLRHVTHFPFMAERTIICNLQATPDDDKCDLRIWATCDVVMRGVMERLGLAPPPPPIWRPADPVPLSVVKQRASSVHYEAAVRLMAEAFPEMPTPPAQPAVPAKKKKPSSQAKSPARSRPRAAGQPVTTSSPPPLPAACARDAQQQLRQLAQGGALQTIRELQTEYGGVGLGCA